MVQFVVYFIGPMKETVGWPVSLPKELVSVVLTTWLDLPDVARLDTASCAKRIRSKVLSVMEFPFFEYELPIREGPESLSHNGIDESKVAVALMDWLLLRNIRVNTLYMAGHSKASSLPIRKYLARHGSLVKKVYICTVSGSNIGWDEYLAAIYVYCPNLTEFNVTNSDIITSDGYKGFAHRWPALQRISLGEKCTDTELLALAKGCKQLRVIDQVRESKRSRAGWLKFFQLAGAHIEEIRVDLPSTGEELCQIARCCPNLRALFLSSTDRFNDATLASIAQPCPKLEAIAIHLTAMTFTMAGVGAITHSGNLTELHLSYPKAGADGHDGWTEVIQRNCRLRILHVDFPFLTPAALQPLCTYCTQLVAVEIHCVGPSPQFRDPRTVAEVFETLVRRNPHLAVLEFDEMPLSDAVLLAVGAHCRCMVRVGFLPNAGITDAGVIALAKGCPRLRCVSALLPPVTMAGVKALATHCRYLRKLQVGENVLGTKPGAGKVAKVGSVEVKVVVPYF